MSYVLGLDFGTSFTAAAAYSGGTTRVVTLGNRAGAVPSVLLVRADGTMIFGEDAYLRGASEPDRLVRNVKRHLGSPVPIVVDGRSFSAEELVAAFLGWVVGRVAEREGGRPELIVATHPANWRSSRLDTFRRAVELSGIAPVAYVTEPYAAAHFQASDHPLEVGDVLAAYDLGGGTFDVAVLRRTTNGYEPAAEPEGVEDLGGVDFDDVMLHLVQTKLGARWTTAEKRGGAAFATAAAGLRRECIAAKEALSVDESVDVPVLLPGVSEPVRVTRQEFERLIRPIVADTLGTFRRELQSARLQPTELAGLLLVGGSSRVPLVRDMISGFVGGDVAVLDSDPKHAVARGAALLAAEGPGQVHAVPEAGSPSVGPPTAGRGPGAGDDGAAPIAVPVTGTGAAAGAAGAAAGTGAAAAAGAAAGTGAAALAGAGIAAAVSPAVAPAVAPGATPGATAAPGVDAAASGTGAPGVDAAASGTGAPGVAGAASGTGAPGPGTTGAPAVAVAPGPGEVIPSDGSRGDGPLGPPAAPRGEGRPRRRRSLVLVGLLAFVAVVAAVAAVVANRSGGNGGATETAAGRASTDGTAGPGGAAAGAAGAAAPTGTSTPKAKPVASADRTVAVPAGEYTVGLASPTAESAAAQKVTLRAFYLDTYEVTNAEYDRFVQSQGAPAPLSWPRNGYKPEQANFPVVGVEWGWAQAYCSALGKRLPTEAEWEVAARGPGGLLYPWGPTPDAVDLDTPGAKAVGSVAANVSPFGVHDTVGSAWEWADEPYTLVGATQRVRVGGENGRVRDGAAMRQVVELTNESATAETGFRCAADTVDPKVPPGQFSDEHVAPQKTPSTTVPASGAAGSSVLVDDRFENTRSGWADTGDGVYKIGYHAPTWYHLDAAQPGVQVVALGGFQYSDVSAEARVYVDKASETGRFRYGLLFRAEGPVRPPPGAKGPNRPEDFYAFVVDPRAGRWELIHEDTLPMRRMLDGALPAGFKATDGGSPDVLRADMKGSAVVLFINGTQVGTFDTRGYHLSGDVGFYAETFDATKAHVHFDELKVTALG